MTVSHNAIASSPASPGLARQSETAPCAAAHSVVATVAGSVPGAKTPTSMQRCTATVRWWYVGPPTMSSALNGCASPCAGIRIMARRYCSGLSRANRTYTTPRMRSPSNGSEVTAAASSMTRSRSEKTASQTASSRAALSAKCR